MRVAKLGKNVCGLSVKRLGSWIGIFRPDANYSLL